MSCHELRLSKDVKKQKAETKIVYRKYRYYAYFDYIGLKTDKRYCSCFGRSYVPLLSRPNFQLFFTFVIENRLKRDLKAYSRRPAIY